MTTIKKIPIPLFMCKKILYDISQNSGLKSFLENSQFHTYSDMASLKKFFKENAEEYNKITDKFINEFINSKAYPSIIFFRGYILGDLFKPKDFDERKDANRIFYKEKGRYFEPKRIIPPLAMDTRHDFFPLVSIDLFLEENIDVFIEKELQKQGFASNSSQIQKVRDKIKQEANDLYDRKHGLLNLFWNFPIFSHMTNYEDDARFEKIQKSMTKITRSTGLFGLWEQPDDFHRKLFDKFEEINNKIESNGGKIQYLQGRNPSSTEYYMTDISGLLDFLKDAA